MLGSSSTTRIFSFAAIGPLPRSLVLNIEQNYLALIHRQQKRKSASGNWLAFHPNLPAVRLNQPLGNRQSQTHAGGGAGHAHKILKDFLVMFLRNSETAVGHVNLDAVRARQTEPAAFLYRRHLGYASLPKMRR